MILGDETKDAYGYYPKDLKHRSNKSILAACDDCGNVRITTKEHYHPLCNSCAKKGKNNPMFGIIGEKHPRFGKHHTKEAKIKLSAVQKGEKSSNWKGGKKVSSARDRFKRRKLGSAFLMPLSEGEVGHHVTNEYVVGTPAAIHEKVSGYTRKKHRALILEWLKDNNTHTYNLVLLVLKNEKERIK